MSPSDTTTASVGVLPLVAEEGNRRLLEEWLEDHEKLRLVEPADSLSERSFDVVVLDEGGLERHIDELQQLKDEARPVLLPYLLLVPEPGMELIEMEGGELVETVLTREIDEIVSLPIRQAELQWRIESLLRLREQSQQAHRRERTLLQYRRAVEGSTDMLAATDDEYRLLFANERYREFHGIPADEVRSATLPEVLGEAEFETARARFEAVLDGEEMRFETERATANGETRVLDVTYYPLEDEGGEIDGVVAAMRDVTDRKEREQALRRTQQAVEASGFAIYITDADGTIEYVNPAFEEITGYAEEEVLGQNPRLLKSGKMSDDYYEALWDTVSSGEIWEEVLVNRRKDGQLYHADQKIAPIVGDDEAIEGFVAIQSDITEQVEATQELATFRDIVQRVDDPIMLQDVDGKFRVLNEAVAEYAGRPVEELVGRDEFAFMDERAATEIARQKDRVLDEERPRTYVVEPSFPTKGTRAFRETRYPHYDEAGDLDGTVAICRDVTDLMERERQLVVVDRVLRHNLRSELTIIQGAAENIADNPRDDSKDHAGQIRAASESLEALAEKERKIVEVLTDSDSPRPVELCQMLARVTAEVTDAHPDSEVAVDCPNGLRVRVLVEFEEALYEVVENAVKHADDSSPLVTVTAARENGSVTISVADSGPGIPEIERGVLEGDAEIDPLTHGSGLGLWFVSHVVAQSAGSVQFRGNDPRGSIVDITVPAADPPDDDGGP